MFDTVVLAGGGKTDPLAKEEQVENKAFIDINGRPMLTYIVSALMRTPSVNRVAVVGPVDQLRKVSLDGYGFEIVPEQDSILNNLAAGFSALGSKNLCLVITADVPLVTSELLEKFIYYCSPFDKDFYYPVLKRESFMASYPGTERTYVRLDAGEVTGGNAVLLRPTWFLDNYDRLEMLISYRKKPLKLMRIMPLTLVVKYLRKKLSLKDLETFFSGLFKLKASAVYCDLVQLGIDVDKLSDLALVRQTLQNRQ